MAFESTTIPAKKDNNNPSILFINKSGLPILVEGWITKTLGLSELKSEPIEPNEEKTIYSNTEQWSIHTYFVDVNMINKWKENNLKIGEELGIFRLSPFYNGSYSWMDNDLFSTEYVDNTIIFSRK